MYSVGFTTILITSTVYVIQLAESSLNALSSNVVVDSAIQTWLDPQPTGTRVEQSRGYN